MDFELDNWQKEILAAKGNLCICSGRQVGKSTIVAIKGAEFSIQNPKKMVLIVSVTEKQAEEMLIKVLLYIKEKYPKMIKKGKDRPTKHKIMLANGSIIRCEPIGQTGIGVLGFTIDLLIADEAAFMPEAVWMVLTPMLLTTGGDVILVSTPNAKEGYFYNAWNNKELGYRSFHVNSEDVAENRKEPQRTTMKRYLEAEKERMTTYEYARWYLAQFLDELARLYTDEWINRVCTLYREGGQDSEAKYFLGVDVARLGGDEITFEIVKLRDERLKHVDSIVETKKLTTWTTNKIIELNNIYNFRKIYIDDGGMGVAILDNLLENEELRSRVEAINNARRSIEYDEKPQKRKLMKEDLYMNLLRLGEQDKIKLLRDDELAQSLRSILYDAKENKVYGSYTHITEGLIRAAWCIKDKGLNIWVEWK